MTSHQFCQNGPYAPLVLVLIYLSGVYACCRLGLFQPCRTGNQRGALIFQKFSLLWKCPLAQEPPNKFGSSEIWSDTRSIRESNSKCHPSLTISRKGAERAKFSSWVDLRERAGS